MTLASLLLTSTSRGSLLSITTPLDVVTIRFYDLGAASIDSVVELEVVETYENTYGTLLYRF